MGESISAGSYRRVSGAVILALFAAVIIAMPAAASAMAENTIRASVGPGGAQAAGPSYGSSISGWSKCVAFESEATTLVAGDTNALKDVFIRDIYNSVTTRVSVGSGNVQADGISDSASISKDAQKVAFRSDGTNLVTGDTNLVGDVFVYDIATKTTVRASVSSDGTQANGPSYDPRMSAWSQFVAFGSDATNLVASDTNGFADVFLRDLSTGVTTRVSLGAGFTQANGNSAGPDVSGDGRYVVFQSIASNLVQGDTNNAWDIFVRDTVTGVTKRVSVSSSGVQANDGSGSARISGDGRFVVFESSATNLVPGDTNGVIDVFVRDLVAGTTTRVNVSATGAQGNAASGVPSISWDGRYVAFESMASNLVPYDSNAVSDVFVRDVVAGITTRVSMGTAVQSNGDSSAAAISPDGSAVSFTSAATNLVTGDTNAVLDVFVHDVPQPCTIENDDAGVTFSRFINGVSWSYSGGSYTYAYSKAPYTGSRLEARFKGNKVRWMGPKNPAYGIAKVYIDGVYKATVDCYSVKPVQMAKIWESAVLPEGKHTISIEMGNSKNPASSGYVVVIDCFEVEGSCPGKVYDRANELNGTFAGGWVKVAGNGTYTDDSYAYSRWPGAKFAYTFKGTKCAWIGPKVYNYGKAAVYIDGAYKGTISQYAPASATAFRARVWESQTLPWGTHTLEIKPLGAKDAASAGTIIVVDAVDYMP